jgi:hypothetical protein
MIRDLSLMVIAVVVAVALARAVPGIHHPRLDVERRAVPDVDVQMASPGNRQDRRVCQLQQAGHH